jgi:hypothetical protein
LGFSGDAGIFAIKDADDPFGERYIVGWAEQREAHPLLRAVLNRWASQALGPSFIFASQSSAQPFNMGKFPQITGYDNQAAASGVAGYEQVVAADQLALTQQCRADVRGVRRCFVIKRRYFDTGGKTLHFSPVFNWPGRDFRAVQELHEHDCGNTKLAMRELMPRIRT